MSYTIRTQTKVLATVDTYGDALAWANANPATKGAAITWGAKGSKMNLREWALIANSTIGRLERQGLDASALLANDGTR